MAIGSLSPLCGELNGYGSQIAIQAHRSQVRIGHDRMPGPVRMNAVTTNQLIRLGSIDARISTRRNHVCREHRPEHICEGYFFPLGDTHRDIA